MNSLRSIFFAVCLFSITSVSAAKSRDTTQVVNQIDTNYIVTFPNHIMGRLYFSRKYTNMLIDNKEGHRDLTYDPNTSLNFGVGVTIKHFTLNLAYGFRFLNEDGKNKGETRHLDLQTHIYKRKYIVDLFGQFYSGLYLNSPTIDSTTMEEVFYLRPDINLQLLGFTALKVKNHERFSYAAPFVQNELQRKSAGSFLYGLSATVFFSSSDSNYLPSSIPDSLYQLNLNVNRMQAVQMGPNVGYAYSLILAKHLFITASFNLGFLIGPVSYTTLDNDELKEWQVNTHLNARVGFGYNSPRWYLGITALQGGTQIRTLDETNEIRIGAGNFRINYVKRFLMGPKLKKKVNKLSL